MSDVKIGSVIDYSKILDEAMRVIVKKALTIAADHGLQGSNHFFVSFITCYPGVKISKLLLSQYPQEMTIVIQYEFYNLKVYDEHFEVSLRFNGINEDLAIPFNSIIMFADPGASFSLQLKNINHPTDNTYDEPKPQTTDVKDKVRDTSKIISLADYIKK